MSVKENQFIVQVSIDVVSKRGAISRRSAELTITTPAERLDKNSKMLKLSIAEYLQPQLKQAIFNITIDEATNLS